MKKLMIFLFGNVLLFSCQTRPQQYFTTCPEIDVIKNTNAAYVEGDWKAMRAAYADTAKIYDNTWDADQFTTADDFVRGLETSVKDYSEYAIGEDAVFEMIVTDKAEKWVHNWFLWKGTHNNGKEVEIPIHLSFKMVDNKVALQVNMYNVLPFYLAAQPMPVAGVPTTE